MKLTHVTLAAILALGLAAGPESARAQGVLNRVRNAVHPARDSAKTPQDTTATAQPATGAAAQSPGQGLWLNYDFVPGDRTIWYEDFSGDQVGDFPRRLELVQGNFEVVEKDGVHYLRTAEGGMVRVILPEKLPARFTVEARYYAAGGTNYLVFHTTEDGDYATWDCEPNGGGVSGGSGNADSRASVENIPEHSFVECRFTIDSRYIKAYLNEHRVANNPTTKVLRGDTILIQIPGFGEEDATLLTNIRIAEGGKKLYDVLAATGRVITHGILFDTGSDRLRPESTPTLKEIGDMLQQHPELKLEIDGHTDNVGAAAANQTLSEKRAAAVKGFLVSSYHIDAGRLATQGFGAAKPVDSNDTAQGRQNNRRVELVKM